MTTTAKVGDVGRIVGVEVKRTDDDLLSVNPIWADVDRPNVGGWAVRNTREANRLTAALLAGVVYDDPRVRLDNAGRTYVHGAAKVLGRYMNADLRRLGF